MTALALVSAAPTSHSLPIRLPLITVIISGYNHGQFLRQTIESVRSQEYDLLECVVIDNHSTDGSFGEVQAHLSDEYDDRFRAIRLGAHLGQMGSLKAGLENTTGPFVVFLKAGDLLRPQFIGRHVAAHLNGAYSAGLSACDTIQIDMEGRILEGTHFSVDKHRSDYSSSPVRPILLSAQNLIRKDELLINAPIEHPVYYVDRLAERSTGASISCHMFRRDLLDLMMPSEPGSLLVGADHYLVVLAHKITGTLTLWDQLVYSRVRRNEDAAHEVILGGPNPSSTLAAETRARVEGQIPIHIAAHFDQIFRVVGPKIVDVVHRYCPPDQLEALRERFPAIKPFIVMQKKSPPKKKKKRWYRLLPNKKWVPGGLRRR